MTQAPSSNTGHVVEEFLEKLYEIWEEYKDKIMNSEPIKPICVEILGVSTEHGGTTYVGTARLDIDETITREIDSMLQEVFGINDYFRTIVFGVNDTGEPYVCII